VKILVTGGAVSIGTSVVRHLLRAGVAIVSLDKLTYAGSNPPLGAYHNYALEITGVAAQTESLRAGLRKTVCWYLDNRAWWGPIRSGVYRGERFGQGIRRADGAR
jgi:dTDP-D-glucose 4,6-dehydratase